MRCFLIGISGYSRTGKDTVAHRLVQQYGAIHLGMTDHAKRHMADAYKFSEEQLFGPSEARNTGDLRYPKPVYFQNKCRPIGKIEPTEVYSGESSGTIAYLNPDKKYHVCEGRGPKGTEKLPYIPMKLGAARYFIEEGDPVFWLSPREALQQYCELLEKLYLGSLIDYAIQTHLQLVPTLNPSLPQITPSHTPQVPRQKHVYSRYTYDRIQGLVERVNPEKHEGHFMTCFSDFRRKHQIQGARDHAGNKLIPVMIRVKRPGIEKPPFKHVSETEQAEIPDSAFDFIIDNDGTIDELNVKIDRIVEAFTLGGWEYLKTNL